jgi:hypothetical protein
MTQSNGMSGGPSKSWRVPFTAIEDHGPSLEDRSFADAGRLVQMGDSAGRSGMLKFCGRLPQCRTKAWGVPVPPYCDLTNEDSAESDC